MQLQHSAATMALNNHSNIRWQIAWLSVLFFVPPWLPYCVIPRGYWLYILTTFCSWLITFLGSYLFTQFSLPDSNHATLYNFPNVAWLDGQKERSGWISQTAYCLKCSQNSKQQRERRSLYPLQQHGWNWRAFMLSEISQVVRDKYRMISPLTGT